MMTQLLRALSLVVLAAVGLSHVACGGEVSGDEGAPPAAGAGPRPSAATTLTDPLPSLTEERLADYIEVLKAAAADPQQDDGDIARERGWKLMEWTWLDAAVKGIASAGSFDAMTQRLHGRVRDADTQIAELEKRLDGTPAEQRSMIERPLQTLRTAREGWRRTLANTAARRVGGELIDANLDEILAALGN